MKMSARFPLLAPVLAAASVIALPAIAHAHPGGPHVHGLTDGFVHPLTGLDHLLAMVAVGLIGARLGGRALWLLPTSFVVTMLVGAGLALDGLELPMVETAIALSLVVFGGLLAANLRAPDLMMAAGVAIFALFHGFAHGTEAPSTASGLTYMAGFVLATALLHGTGILAAMLAGRGHGKAGDVVMRGYGIAIAATGLVLVTAN
ncbi:HupE/UreJ family protein [Methylobrevis pamukkalensis]|uniref:HupE / UreJ protein n=1 Tax=Methylobrevis pamukkalensis TaxID=1439726 RepID=A0A1E3GYL9_9HYPH|nr:HupE/UreJ family protein [Methylobrevis pamukkalensis]ODN69167.1 HupE / UreJ protein [Methylobrevis pamukkalensis]